MSSKKAMNKNLEEMLYFDAPEVENCPYFSRHSGRRKKHLNILKSRKL